MFYYYPEKSPFGNNFCIDQYQVVAGLNDFPILDLPSWIVGYLQMLECIKIVEPQPQAEEVKEEALVTEEVVEPVKEEEKVAEQTPTKKTRKTSATV